MERENDRDTLVNSSIDNSTSKNKKHKKDKKSSIFKNIYLNL